MQQSLCRSHQRTWARLQRRNAPHGATQGRESQNTTHLGVCGSHSCAQNAQEWGSLRGISCRRKTWGPATSFLGMGDAVGGQGYQVFSLVAIDLIEIEINSGARFQDVLAKVVDVIRFRDEIRHPEKMGAPIDA